MKKIINDFRNFSVVYAAYGSLNPNDSDTSIGAIIVRALNYLLPLLGGVALVMVIYGGVLFITSSGDPEKLTKAKQTLLWAIIGIIIIVLSYAIVVSLSKVIEGKIII